ncbi:MAG TPA: CDP-alcohol phosphatidyltransferase family protein, partial [Myxococcota bacterium]
MKITANQVTIVRILALPFPCWALTVRPPQPWMWIAFVAGVLVGATDFVDGWMARRDGPTQLGALLDPVADKLFIA